MRHRKQRSKLSMMRSRRKATVINMVSALFTYQRIETILARAKVVRRHAEKLITLSKTDTVAARRQAYQILNDRDLVGKLFKEIGPLCKDRTSGFTRIIQLGFRRGDGAQMAILELTDKKIVEKLVKKKKGKAKEGKAAEVKKAAKAEVKEEAKVPTDEKHDESKIKHIAKSKPTFDEEKRAEKAKSEDRKISDQKGFMKNIRGLFRKRGDR